MATAFSPISVSTALSSISSSRLASARLPEFGGLRIKPASVTQPIQSVSRSSRRNRTAAGSIFCEAQNAAIQVAPVTDSTWQSLVLDSTLPVLVEFSAPWCGPCRIIHPLIEELAKEYAGKFKFYKVNTDESPGIAAKYGIRSIPTVLIFKSGEKRDAVIGAVPKSTLTSSIEKFL
ncbi:hypothetical protein SAY87_012148 [Trapa incisa]|uniref:Thioredoxin domain-containing protein n=1 Tax=Trapa incisa TaxID=236973 RepID=A0AAN7JBY6_9MYRT|nr:hypothetical protein SAY87_012148 [Trapa incisa]